jgi:hypothetical protein
VEGGAGINADEGVCVAEGGARVVEEGARVAEGGTRVAGRGVAVDAAASISEIDGAVDSGPVPDEVERDKDMGGAVAGEDAAREDAAGEDAAGEDAAGEDVSMTMER